MTVMLEDTHKKPLYQPIIKKAQSLIPQTLGADRFALKGELNRLKQRLNPNKNPEKGKKQAAELLRKIQNSVDQRKWRQQHRPRPDYPEQLPIVARRDEIVAAIQQQPVVIISGETGSGKTTQIPKFCLEAGRGIDGRIGCTQPRRIAAITVANRIAEELGEPAGKSVGYQVRFQDTSRANAFIKIMTDGILLAETQGDPFLNAYDTLIVDEAHERSLNIDFTLGILKNLLKKRKDLKLIVTSATIDTEKFSRAFDHAPVIEVSGRTYPVEVQYRPPEPSRDDDEVGYVDMAVAAVEKLHRESPYSGDVLVFMPTEADIRETCELLEARRFTGMTVLPLFARLSGGEQARVFGSVRGRKVIVATNVAETSITIPGIRYVVDTGLARISSYSPRNRTTSLPVSPISQSSADQRKGRSGRVQNGVCIRLYSEEDYLSRERFTPPEILRSNLAEVILRMIALKLGDLSRFPFIDRPAEKNIKDGFLLLKELGAIEAAPKRARAAYQLTHKGRLMAKIPLDPRLSRILIEARAEDCLPAIAVIVSALSIQDPRERPTEKEAQADQAHAAFKDKRSDFLTLLNIWHEYHGPEGEKKSNSQKKKFCKASFLSFKRMREWCDIHSQILAILRESGLIDGPLPEPARVSKDEEGFTAAYTAIHKSLLSGFLSNIAMKKEKKIFTGAKGKELMIFPGSGLFNRAGEWIVAAEMVETSRLFGRMVAGIDPDWLEPLAGDQCKSTYLNPRWERKQGQVVADEQVSLYGLIIVPRRKVSYGPIDPETANDIFIQTALVEGDLRQPFAFMKHNQKQIHAIRNMEDKIRRRELMVSDEALFDFYKARLDGVYDIRTLNGRIKKRGNDNFLRMRKAELLAADPDDAELALYPDRIELGERGFKCDYHFVPGSEADGVTLRVSADQAASVPAEALDWLVPGLFKEKVAALLKGLPKAYRRKLVPVTETAEIIYQEMEQTKALPLITALGNFIQKRFGLNIPASAWPEGELPDHLKMRISVRGPRGEELRAGRDKQILSQSIAPQTDVQAFEAARRNWEKTGITDWDFGDLPESLTLKGENRAKWHAYPALIPEEKGVRLSLLPRRPEALQQHKQGVQRLYEIRLSSELKFLKKALAIPSDLQTPSRYFGGPKQLQEKLYQSVLQSLFHRDIRDQKAFLDHAEAVRPELVKAGRNKLEAVWPLLQTYHGVRAGLYDLERTHKASPLMLEYLEKLRADLDQLMPENFLALYSDERLGHLERYVRTIGIRAKRGVVDFAKDQAKAKAIAPYTQRLHQMLKTLDGTASGEKRAALEDFYWTIEEYKVSLFAQELKTAVPVSPKRLDQKQAAIERMV